jgi:plastocyanin
VITKTGGDNQIAAAGTALAALEVTVKDGSGNALSGVMVNWAAASGGGSVNPPSSVTGADGKATTTRTLGAGAGTQTTTAGATGATAVTFSAVAQIQGATQIAFNGSASFSDTVLSTRPLSAVVRDQNSDVVAGVIVNWSVTAGGGLLSQAVDTTDGTGISTVNLTLSLTSGAQTASATVTGLIGSPVIFSDNSTAGNAVSMALNGGNFQAGPINAALPTAHTVIVHDAYNNPKSGASVTWVIGLGGGSITPNGTATTNGSGIASVTRTLGAVAGVHTDTARVTGLTGSPVAFTDTAAAVVSVQLSGTQFTPANDTTTAGAFARFTWGSGTHNVTWDNTPPSATLQNSPTQSSGTFTARLTATGSYTFHCSIHGGPGTGMHGEIVAQ